MPPQANIIGGVSETSEPLREKAQMLKSQIFYQNELLFTLKEAQRASLAVATRKTKEGLLRLNLINSLVSGIAPDIL